MANSGYVVGVYSGRPSNDAILEVWRYAVSGNQSRWTWRLTARKFGATSYVLNAYSWSVNVLGYTWSGSHNLDFRNTSSIVISSGTTGWVNHTSAGYLNVYFSFSHPNVSIFGTASGSSSFAADRILKAPGAVAAPTFQSATTTSISFGITLPSDDGGAPVTTYNLQALYTDGSVALAWNSGSSNQVASPLPPGTPYRIRYRAVNSVGAGPWSDELNASTLPSVPPGMTVTPSLSGTSVSIALTPPQGVSSVTSYRVERRPIGGAAVVYNSPTSPIVIQPMTPGTTHEYRASAFIGDYQTPWTGWVTRTQPQPNTNPGDYFDGSSAARGDLTFAWLGTANNSVSVARGVLVAGWQAATVSGASPILQRITGGRNGMYAARAIARSDATTYGGLYLGMAFSGSSNHAQVAEGGLYAGSIYVRPSRAQRLSAEIVWINSSGDEISRISGDSLTVADLAGWTRLTVSGTAPVGAVTAVVRAKDSPGDGFSPWLGGEYLDADSVMLSIGSLIDWFSGDSPDTATWEYSWLGAANASVSQATAIPAGTVDPLADPDCPPIPRPPQPPAITDDCIEEVGSWRRYWAIIPNDQVSDWLDLVPTISITTGTLPARQVRIRVYRNPDALDPASFPATDWEAEQIVSYMPASTTLVLDGVAQRVWAEVNGGELISADRLLYGSGGGPASWPVLSCGTAYLLSFDVPLDAPEGNLSVDVALTTRML